MFVKDKNRERQTVLCLLALLMGTVLLAAGCGKIPAVDDVAEADPNAGLIEAWGGEEEFVEEDPMGPYTVTQDWYDENGTTVIGRNELEFDAEGFLIREENFDLEGNSIERWEREYADGGLRERMRFYRNGVAESGMEMIYDAEWNIIEQRFLDADGNVIGMMGAAEEGGNQTSLIYDGDRVVGEIVYDEAGRAIRQVSYDENGNTLYTMEHEYDAEGREIRFLMTDANGVITNDNRTVYAADGSIARTENYDENGNLKRYYCDEYDEQGRVLKSVTYTADGTVYEYTQFLYREDGRCARTEKYNAKDELEMYSEFNYWPDGSYRVNTYDPTGLELLATEKYTADGMPEG